jgi:hypothetical protein
MWYSNVEETFISRNLLHQHWYTLVPSLYQCVETRSIEVIWLLSQPLPQLRFDLFIISVFSTFLDPLVKCITRQTLPTINRAHIFMNILCVESFCPQKRATGVCFSVVYFSSMVVILTTETSLVSMRMPVYYLDCHEAELCCCLLIHIENLLRPLQLF